MLKREITYEDFNGDTVTDIFYFNISEPELIEMEVEYDKGFGSMIQSIIDAKNNKELIHQFKRIVLMAYGIKSEDGKRFVKSEELRVAFSQSAAYTVLFMELATDDGKAALFIKSIMPKKFAEALEKAETSTQTA